MSDDVVMIEITLRRIITDSGRMAVKVITPPSYSAVELLGVLEAAKLHIFNEMGRFNDC